MDGLCVLSAAIQWACRRRGRAELMSKLDIVDTRRRMAKVQAFRFLTRQWTDTEDWMDQRGLAR